MSKQDEELVDISATQEPEKEPEGDYELGDELELQEPDPEPESPKPGTPDKERQRLQQELAAANRKLEQLASIAEQRDLTPAEEAAEKKAVDSLALLEGKLADSTYDLFDDGESLAKVAIESAKEARALRAELEQIRKELGPVAAERQWRARQAEYENLSRSQLEQIWQKAIGEAKEMIPDPTQAQLQAAATKIFHRSAAAASEGAKGKARATPPAPVKPVPESTPQPASPGPGKTGMSDKDRAYIDTAMGLLAPDE